MNPRHIVVVILAACLLNLAAVNAAHPVVERTTPVIETADAAEQSENLFTWSQIIFAIAVVVLVLLVLILIAGFFIYAVDNETPEQKLQRKLNQQELSELAKCVGVYYATAEALKKLK